MKVCVHGLWHLGTVTAACLASAGYDVTAVDPDVAVVEALRGGVPPVFEPGLEQLVNAGVASGRLRFTSHAAAGLADADVVWVAGDTPVDEDDRADVGAVVGAVTGLFPHLRDQTLLLLSSQVPVGTTRRLEQAFAAASAGREVGFAYSPENLRLGSAIEAFTRPERVVAGVRSPGDRARIAELLQPFTSEIEWMSVESAEMTKHALNAFLATSISFINEVAALCEQIGADASDVARGLKSDRRIGPRAYLSPGAAFAGGTLARDVMFLAQLGNDQSVPTPLISGVKASNDAHRHWAQRRLTEVLGSVAGMTVAVWGLTYKPGTNTLRRSAALELCRWLANEGATVRAHDPVTAALPPDAAAGVELASDPLDAVRDATALVVATPWPDYVALASDEVRRTMAGNLVLDAGGFLAATFGRDPAFCYLRVGHPTP